MKLLKHVPAALLAFLFLFGGLNFFFHFVPDPTLTGKQLDFMVLFGGTGYMTVIKVLEVVGGLLILFPAHRAKAVLLLGPIAVNILLFEIYIAGAIGIGAVVVLLVLAQAYIDQDKFKALL
ncbi:MAG: hypothetical protein RI981_1214 [Bacteroidota bacterium]|jgi:hypothetical protein